MIETQKKVLDLLNVMPAGRDEAWERSFLEALPAAHVTVLHPEARTGPDSWPYLFIEISAESDEPFMRVVEWLTERGIGLAVNPQKAIPDFVLPYGMLCNLRMTGRLMSELPEFASPEVRARDGQIYVAEPNETYLPTYLRGILRSFLRDQKVLAPRLTLVSEDRVIYDIAFSLESLGSPPEKEHQGISEALSWFLPAHYGIVLVSEKRLSGFVDL